MLYSDNTHLVADSLEELHLFCKKVGIKRCWFEGTKKGHPHYDIPKNYKSIISLMNEVKKVGSKKILHISKKLLENEY